MYFNIIKYGSNYIATYLLSKTKYYKPALQSDHIYQPYRPGDPLGIDLVTQKWPKIDPLSYQEFCEDLPIASHKANFAPGVIC